MSKIARTMSLQQKVSVTLFAVMIAMALVSYTILDAKVAPAFDNLEQNAARTNLVRAQRAIQAELDNLTTASNDWSIWDDAYAYMTGRYDGFANSNLETATLVTLEMDLMLFFELDGDLRWGRFLIDGQPQRIESLGIFAQQPSPDEFLLSHQRLDSEIRGPIATNAGPMLIVSKPILTTAGTGPIAGTLIMGRFLDEALQVQLRERTEVALEWRSFDDYHDPADPELVQQLRDNPAAIVQRQAAREIASHTTIRDLSGIPLLLLKATTQRNISALGQQTLSGALLFLAVAAVVVTAVTWGLLRTIIVVPMEKLAAHMIGMRHSGDLSVQLEMQRDDEFGALAEEFDKLTDEVRDARQLMLEQSFKAGRADTASEVLHNIRNAMTPLINSVDRLGQQLGVADKLKVRRATRELRDADCPQERRDKLILYIDSAFERILESNATGKEELAVASKQARQIEGIVSDQERHAKAAPVVENLGLDELISEAMLVIPKKRSPQVDVEIAAELDRFRVKVHRVGLLQVMGNVILNAYEAIQRGGSGSGKICLRAEPETVDDLDMVKVTVSDTGCGFSDDEQNRMFQRGYSSKEGNLSGLGLHWCANALAGMGGRIVAESSGSGNGAEFHVLLPAA